MFLLILSSLYKEFSSRYASYRKFFKSTAPLRLLPPTTQRHRPSIAAADPPLFLFHNLQSLLLSFGAEVVTEEKWLVCSVVIKKPRRKVSRGLYSSKGVEKNQDMFCEYYEM
ncbi:uncharacterized protein LOC120092857 [Benincasa hispida]|uniref:uncharacterized protein LOC120092857 n=1 Tax=Benincasa hispida TaxID=102211 RepID=UPI0019000B91|nr:uncharacterized protein LOC120092857 [Benincasa hispida]